MGWRWLAPKPAVDSGKGAERNHETRGRRHEAPTPRALRRRDQPLEPARATLEATKQRRCEAVGAGGVAQRHSRIVGPRQPDKLGSAVLDELLGLDLVFGFGGGVCGHVC